MTMASITQRARNRTRRVLAARFARQRLRLNPSRAYVSFTFDDFPRSALDNGGRILRTHGLAGTFYLATGLMGRDSEVGPIVGPEDVRRAVAEGHEIGCHTAGHLDAAVADPAAFRRSLQENQARFGEIVPGGRLRSFAYPFDGPRLAVKRAVAGCYETCRGGGQAANIGSADLDLLRAYFVDARTVDRREEIGSIIRDNARERGWLIVATHDVCDSPSPFGCRGEVLEYLVRQALESGARIVPVAQAKDELTAEAQPV